MILLNSGMMSSKTDEWATPDYLFSKLDAEYKFTLDPCATPENAKCEKFLTREDNGLIQSWAGENVFMNPPYGRKIGLWMKKAFEESLKGVLVVCLIPARTDTKWWHDYAMKGEVRFIRGRVKFGGHKHNAPFPNAIIVFNDPEKLRQEGLFQSLHI